MQTIFSPYGTRNIAALVVHCSATPAGRDLGVATIREWHASRGWSGIGYHYVICRDGRVEAGRDVSRSGAHVRGYNAHTIGICLVGGVDKNQNPEPNYTDAQWKTLSELLDDLEVRLPGVDICGHRDFPNVAKACPCFDVREWRKTGITPAMY